MGDAVSYDDIAAVFMDEDGRRVPQPVTVDSPARRLRDAVEPIATQGWWSRAAAEALAPSGLDFFTAYVVGRAASLGAPTGAVVAATFGVFDPVVIGTVHDAGVAVADRDAILAARERGAAASLATVCTAAEADAVSVPLLDALATVDGLGRPLFSALRALPLPDDAHGRLWRAAELVREHRGDAHLAAIVASGLSAAQANVLTELWLGYAPGEYSHTRAMSADGVAGAVAQLTELGWVADGGLTEAGLQVRVRLELATDTGQQQLIDALGGRLDAVVDAAGRIGGRLLAAGAVPTDARKRAAG